jgi:hypothetical protein
MSGMSGSFLRPLRAAQDYPCLNATIGGRDHVGWVTTNPLVAGDVDHATRAPPANARDEISSVASDGGASAAAVIAARSATW